MPKCYCGKWAAFNIRGETTGCFCVDHKDPNMINVKNKTCDTTNCEKQPIYNVRGEKMGRFCVDHKDPDMIDVKNKTCEMDGCNVIPNFNVRGEKSGRFCTDHKDLDMIDVKNKTCEMKGCGVRPIYNIRGETIGRFCVDHKDPDMIDVKNKTCEVADCNIRPTFNVRGETVGRFCANHKDASMIIVTKKTCSIENCEKQPRYGWLGKGTSRCGPHRQKGMILSPNRSCVIAYCRQLGAYQKDIYRYCDNHKLEDSTNLGIELCSICGLDDILTNGKCSTCDPFIIQYRQHAKENHIGDVLRASGVSPDIHDKTLEGPQCGRERPDFQYDCGTHFVYLEVDENQHRTYARECEQVRMINLVEVRGMPVRFIRYNPDAYNPLNGQCIVKQEQREKKLVEYVKYAINHPPQYDGGFSNVLYLFYDEYNTTEQLWHVLC